MQRAVNSNHITLRQHLLQIRNPPTPNLLLNLRLQRLIIKVQQLLTIKRLQTSQHSLPNPSHSNRTDNFAFQVKLVLGRGCDVPFTGLDLLVGGHEVADEDQDRHHDVLGDGDDVGAGHFGNGDAAVGLVGGIEVDVVGADAGGDGELEVLGFGETFGGEVAGVEAGCLLEEV